MISIKDLIFFFYFFGKRIVTVLVKPTVLSSAER